MTNRECDCVVNGVIVYVCVAFVYAFHKRLVVCSMRLRVVVIV